MRKIYRYDNLTFKAGLEENVEFCIKFISNGNIGHTVINIPGNNDPEIANDGRCSLGLMKNLLDPKTFAVSDIANPIPQADKIVIEYYLNDKLLVRHENAKNVTERPYIFLSVKFIAS